MRGAGAVATIRGLRRAAAGPKSLVAGTEQTRTRYDLLSDREREILVLLAEGESMKDVAQRLRLSVKTVDAHKVNLMRKLELHDRSELIRYAVRKKLIEV